jgi:hypothetical protein
MKNEAFLSFIYKYVFMIRCRKSGFGINFFPDVLVFEGCKYGITASKIESIIMSDTYPKGGSFGAG